MAKAQEAHQGKSATSRVGSSPTLNRVGSPSLRVGASPDYEARIMKATIPPVMRARRMSETCELNGGRVMQIHVYRPSGQVYSRVLYILVCVWVRARVCVHHPRFDAHSLLRARDLYAHITM